MLRSPRALRALCVLSVIGASGFLPGCVETIPEAALQLSSESLQRRESQTRRFDTDDEGTMLSASVGVLQDLGFNIAHTHTPLGVVVGEKDRSAVEVGQIVAAVLIAAIVGAPMPIDKNQRIRVSLITRPLTGDRSGMAVRVTFQRIVTTTQNQISRIEGIDDPAVYQEFFERLSKSVFLEANPI